MGRKLRKLRKFQEHFYCGVMPGDVLGKDHFLAFSLAAHSWHGISVHEKPALIRSFCSLNLRNLRNLRPYKSFQIRWFA